MTHRLRTRVATAAVRRNSQITQEQETLDVPQSHCIPLGSRKCEAAYNRLVESEEKKISNCGWKIMRKRQEIVGGATKSEPGGSPGS